MAFKTIITYPNYEPLSPEAIDTILLWAKAQAEAGKYTSGHTDYYEPDGTTFVVERWEWSDQEVCQEYFALVNSLTTEPNSDIITELVTL